MDPGEALSRKAEDPPLGAIACRSGNSQLQQNHPCNPYITLMIPIVSIFFSIIPII